MPENEFLQNLGRFFTPLLSTSSTWLLIIFFCAFFLIKKYSRNLKGMFGEWILSVLLHNWNDGECIILDDVTLELSMGDTTQIDHIIVSPTGIFVIETKFYQGRIYGRYTDKEWTQKIFRNTYRFQNPFRQNYKHVKAVQVLFPDIQHECIHSIVFMSGGCQWGSSTRPERLFTSGKEVLNYINDNISENPSVIDVGAVDKRFREVRLKRGLKTNIEHVRNLRRNRKK